MKDITNNKGKLYLGNCELITQNGNAQWNTFISGPMGVFGAVTSNGTTESLRYIYKDHLGSWTTLTDDQGTVLQELSFDAWGNLRASASWSGQYNGVLLYDRGFTGHEHMTAFGLINMNGRCYDPLTSSFLSVDAYVQDPRLLAELQQVCVLPEQSFEVCCLRAGFFYVSVSVIRNFPLSLHVVRKTNLKCQRI